MNFGYNNPVVTHYDTSTERPPRTLQNRTTSSLPHPPTKYPVMQQQNGQSKTISLITNHLSFLVNNPRVLTREQETFMFEICSSFANTLTKKDYILSDREEERGTSDSDITESETYPMFETNSTDEKIENSSESSDDELKTPLISEYDQLRSGSCTPDHSDHYLEQLDQTAKLEINFPSSNNWATFENDSNIKEIKIGEKTYSGTIEVVESIAEVMRGELSVGCDKEFDEPATAEESFFLDKLSKASLSSEEKGKLTEAISEEEVGGILFNEVDKDSSPGEDGITYRFMQAFWDMRSYRFLYVNFLNYVRKIESFGLENNNGIMVVKNKKLIQLNTSPRGN